MSMGSCVTRTCNEFWRGTRGQQHLREVDDDDVSVRCTIGASRCMLLYSCIVYCIIMEYAFTAGSNCAQQAFHESSSAMSMMWQDDTIFDADEYGFTDFNCFCQEKHGPMNGLGSPLACKRTTVEIYDAGINGHNQYIQMSSNDTIEE